MCCLLMCLWQQFEKILVVGLKERSDRRDVMALQASLTGINIEWMNGLKGEDVIDKALPPVHFVIVKLFLSES